MFKFFFSALFFISSLSVWGADLVKTTKIEGKYRVYSVESKKDYTVVHFEKFHKSKVDKTVYIELTTYNHSFMSVGTVLEMTAEVIDNGKNTLEAEQILVNRQHGEGIFLLSRKGKIVNFEKASYSKMNNVDFKIL